MTNKQSNILMKEQTLRSTSWGHHFIFLNCLLAICIGFVYVYASPSTESFISFVYLCATWFGQISFLGFLAFLILFFPLSFIGNFKWYKAISICLAIILHCILLIDAKLFLTIKVHLTWSVTALVLRDLNFNTGLNFNFLYIAIPVIIFLEFVFARLATREVYKKDLRRNYFPSIVMGFVSICFVASHCIYIWADASGYEKITNLRSVFPAHYPMTARSFLSNHGWIDSIASSSSVSTSNIVYPLEPIEALPKENQKNVITIFINGMSYADLDVNNTPNLMNLKISNLSLENHYLPYISVEDNLFAAIYSLPKQYRSEFEKHSIENVAISEMQRQEYIVRGFSHGAVKNEEKLMQAMTGINKTRVKNLNKDSEIFEAATKFIETNKDRHYAVNVNTSTLLTAIRSPAQYKKSLREIDTLVGDFVNALDEMGVLQNTYVMITSAAGNAAYASVNSSFSKRVQRVPFIIMWPDNLLRGISINSLTSHFDISPTIGIEILGIQTPCVNYGIGSSVLLAKDRDYITTTRGNSLLLVSKDTVTVYKRNGRVETDNEGVIKSVKPNLENLIRAMRDLNRFKG